MIRKKGSRSLCQVRKHETKHFEKEIILAILGVDISMIRLPTWMRYEKCNNLKSFEYQ